MTVTTKVLAGAVGGGLLVLTLVNQLGVMRDRWSAQDAIPKQVAMLEVRVGKLEDIASDIKSVSAVVSGMKETLTSLQTLILGAASEQAAINAKVVNTNVRMDTIEREVKEQIDKLKESK